MTFFIVTTMFMLFGRKLGWALSKSTLYTTPPPDHIMFCILWGVGVAAVIHRLIEWQQPSFILRWIMGYALGWYVAVPNFGLINESTIPGFAKWRHDLISTLPPLAYLISSLAIAFL